MPLFNAVSLVLFHPTLPAAVIPLAATGSECREALHSSSSQRASRRSLSSGMTSRISTHAAAKPRGSAFCRRTPPSLLAFPQTGLLPLPFLALLAPTSTVLQDASSSERPFVSPGDIFRKRWCRAVRHRQASDGDNYRHNAPGRAAPSLGAQCHPMFLRRHELTELDLAKSIRAPLLCPSMPIHRRRLVFPDHPPARGHPSGTSTSEPKTCPACRTSRIWGGTTGE